MAAFCPHNLRVRRERGGGRETEKGLRDRKRVVRQTERERQRQRGRETEKGK